MNSSQLGKVCGHCHLKSCYSNGYHFINQLKAGSSAIWCCWEVCWAARRPALLVLHHWLPKLLIQYRSWLGAMSCFLSQQTSESIKKKRCFFSRVHYRIFEERPSPDFGRLTTAGSRGQLSQVGNGNFTHMSLPYRKSAGFSSLWETVSHLLLSAMML